MENKIYPHILLKRGDVIRIPSGVEQYAKVEDMIDGILICSIGCNMFSAPWGFYYKIDEWENIFEPIIEEKH